jgi:hypothetical protein
MYGAAARDRLPRQGLLRYVRYHWDYCGEGEGVGYACLCEEYGRGSWGVDGGLADVAALVIQSDLDNLRVSIVAPEMGLCPSKGVFRFVDYSGIAYS